MKEKDFVIINNYRHLLYKIDSFDSAQMRSRSADFYHWLESRRSVRHISDRPVPKEVINNLIMSASTAPSGAHKQPWTFCAISNPALKRQIRLAAEKEEKENYDTRMSERWKQDLLPLGTDMHKPFLEIAPWLIIVFKQIYEYDEHNVKHNNYYVNESVGIACGILLTAIHHAGLVTLTHTPSPMNFLNKILNRPDNERAFLICPIGYPEQPAFVPDIQRKNLDDVSVFYE